MLNSKWSNKSPNFRWIMDSPSNVYRVYTPIRSDQTKSSILGRLWIVLPIYIEFISPIEKVKYLLVHYKEELKLIQQISLEVGCLVLPWSTRKTNHKHTFRRFVTMRLLKSCSFLARYTLSPSFMNVRQGIHLFRYIGRQFLLLVAIIRRMT